MSQHTTTDTVKRILEVPGEYGLRLLARTIVQSNWFRSIVSLSRDDTTSYMHFGNPKWGIKIPMLLGAAGLQLGAGAVQFKNLPPNVNALLREVCEEAALELTDAFLHGRVPTQEELQKAKTAAEHANEKKLVVVKRSDGTFIAHDAACVSDEAMRAVPVESSEKPGRDGKKKKVERLSRPMSTVMSMRIPLAKDCPQCGSILQQAEQDMALHKLGGSVVEVKIQKPTSGEQLGELAASNNVADLAALSRCMAFFDRWSRESPEIKREIERRILPHLDKTEVFAIANVGLKVYEGNDKKMYDEKLSFNAYPEHDEQRKMIARGALRTKSFGSSLEQGLEDLRIWWNKEDPESPEPQEIVTLRCRNDAAARRRQNSWWRRMIFGFFGMRP